MMMKRAMAPLNITLSDATPVMPTLKDKEGNLLASEECVLPYPWVVEESTKFKGDVRFAIPIFNCHTYHQLE
jgi:hypothetical protein